MIGSRGGDDWKFFLENRAICFGKLSVETDRYLNGVGGNADDHRDVVRSSFEARSK